MHTALKNLWASAAIEAEAVLDRGGRSGAGDLMLETNGLRPTDRSRPLDLTLAGRGGARAPIPTALVVRVGGTGGPFLVPSYRMARSILAPTARRLGLPAGRFNSVPRH
eukprot:jgi/Tetstr1/422731/TSEL_013528.t1